MDTDNNCFSHMTQINDNIGSKYVINNNMVSVIFKYFINNITKGFVPIINANIIVILYIRYRIFSARVDPPL